MARRKAETFSLSFLDVISCGFGAVVLFYTIISAQSGLMRMKENENLQSEVDRLEQAVLEGYQNLAVIKNSMRTTEEEARRTEGLADRIIDETRRMRVQLADAEGDTLSRREAIERLKADLKSLEEGARRLEGGAESPGQRGQKIRGFVGSGDRQYLTGLRVGGERILILVDASASMLDETVVNVIRMRNMSTARKLLSAKWRQAVSTVDWLAAQLPLESRFQIHAFNTKAWPLLAGSEGQWLAANDPKALNGALAGLREVVPADGTSLENALAVLATLSPRPDNVILLTDGLPTQGPSAPSVRRTIDGDGRLKLFDRAMRQYPREVPLNVILFPMEGDPGAPSAYWLVARQTGGSFLSPSKDWP